jgi:Type II CAAX prenyl endopeptidase Rce1-like
MKKTLLFALAVSLTLRNGFASQAKHASSDPHIKSKPLISLQQVRLWPRLRHLLIKSPPPPPPSCLQSFRLGAMYIHSHYLYLLKKQILFLIPFGLAVVSSVQMAEQALFPVAWVAEQSHSCFVQLIATCMDLVWKILTTFGRRTVAMAQILSRSGLANSAWDWLRDDVFVEGCKCHFASFSSQAIMFLNTNPYLKILVGQAAAQLCWTVVFSPIVEEVCYRLICQRICSMFSDDQTPQNFRKAAKAKLWFNRYEPWAFLSSILFSFGHIQNWYQVSGFTSRPIGVGNSSDVNRLLSAVCQIGTALFLGLEVFSPLYQKYGLFASIGAHMVWNAYAVLLAVVALSSVEHVVLTIRQALL